MNTSTVVTLTLMQKPGIAECRVYTLNIENYILKDQICSYNPSSYEDHEAFLKSHIDAGNVVVYKIEDLPVL